MGHGFKGLIKFFAHRIDGLLRGGSHFDAVADHEHVVARFDAEAHCFIEPVVV